MAIPKQFANKVLSNLDNAASRIEQLAKSGQMDPRLASALVRDVDAFADRFEVAAYGKDSFARRQAKVLEGDKDENKYMTSFNAPQKVHQDGTGHDYLKKTEPGVRWDKTADHMDGDYYSAVMDRPEYKVEGAHKPSEKQPSMHGEFRAHKSSTKTWAD